jgi:hypothetical protein
MTAREIAAALGNARREGRDWRCQCPVHRGYSLTLRDGRDTLLVKCWGGCTAPEILDALRSRGLIDGVPDPEQEEARRKRAAAAAKAEVERAKRKIDRARSLYQRGAPVAGTPVEVYLRSRGITIPIPPALRYLRWCPHRNGRYFPAMIAPIVNVAGEQTAIHKTFLKPDGSGKADLPKEEQRETCGPMKGAAVRLAPPWDGACSSPRASKRRLLQCSCSACRAGPRSALPGLRRSRFPAACAVSSSRLTMMKTGSGSEPRLLVTSAGRKRASLSKFYCRLPPVPTSTTYYGEANNAK